MTWVSMCWITSPKYYTICTIFDFSKGTTWNADVLNCNKGCSMTDRCCVIYKCTNLFSNGMPNTLCLTRGRAPSVHGGFFCVCKNFCCVFDCFIVRDIYVTSVLKEFTWASYPVAGLRVKKLFSTDCTGIFYVEDFFPIIT
eukprot:TRINITY_DN7604_c0_g1_i1.p5 TRINITY_DN7604_c0_g1~~TRINITY_DN7604_c0_g1_i1.p5  ORF type:complete len:141 (-),score=0.29 TRINITY_DN7604_c0_g1_i1:99-521(-)